MQMACKYRNLGAFLTFASYLLPNLNKPNSHSPRFLLPRLHLDRLNCQTNVRGLRNELTRLPRRLDQTYDEALSRIHGQTVEEKDLAMLALTWVFCALRPLTILELQHALATRPGDKEFDEEGLVDESLLMSVTAGLITLDAQSQIVRLVHFTVQEYFKRTREKWFPEADIYITKVCLGYLSFADRNEVEYSLISYARDHWGHHAVGEPDERIGDLIVDFLSDEHILSTHFHSPGLPFAADLELIRITRKFLKSGVPSDLENGYPMTALQIATGAGHEAVARLLLDFSANTDHRSSFLQQTAISVATFRGYIDVMQSLLAHIDTSMLWASWAIHHFHLLHTRAPKQL